MLAPLVSQVHRMADALDVVQKDLAEAKKEMHEMDMRLLVLSYYFSMNQTLRFIFVGTAK